MKTTTNILWKSKSQETFLPGYDLVWNTFCEVRENGEHNAAAIIVVNALNKYIESWSPQTMEFKLDAP